MVTIYTAHDDMRVRLDAARNEGLDSLAGQAAFVEPPARWYGAKNPGMAEFCVGGGGAEPPMAINIHRPDGRFAGCVVLLRRTAADGTVMTVRDLARALGAVAPDTALRPCPSVVAARPAVAAAVELAQCAGLDLMQVLNSPRDASLYTDTHDTAASLFSNDCMMWVVDAL